MCSDVLSCSTIIIIIIIIIINNNNNNTQDKVVTCNIFAVVLPRCGFQLFRILLGITLALNGLTAVRPPLRPLVHRNKSCLLCRWASSSLEIETRAKPSSHTNSCISWTRHKCHDNHQLCESHPFQVQCKELFVENQIGQLPWPTSFNISSVPPPAPFSPPLQGCTSIGVLRREPLSKNLWCAAHARLRMAVPRPEMEGSLFGCCRGSRASWWNIFNWNLWWARICNRKLPFNDREKRTTPTFCHLRF